MKIYGKDIWEKTKKKTYLEFSRISFSNSDTHAISHAIITDSVIFECPNSIFFVPILYFVCLLMHTCSFSCHILTISRAVYCHVVFFLFFDILCPQTNIAYIHTMWLILSVMLHLPFYMLHSPSFMLHVLYFMLYNWYMTCYMYAIFFATCTFFMIHRKCAIFHATCAIFHVTYFIIYVTFALFMFNVLNFMLRVPNFMVHALYFMLHYMFYISCYIYSIFYATIALLFIKNAL